MLPYHFTLVDVNTNYFNCGHYPELEVVKVDGPCPAERRDHKGRVTLFETRQSAMDAADRRNASSRNAFREFLDA